LERMLDRMTDISILESEHGPSDARRYDYIPTYIFRGLISLNISYTSLNESS
jgi:cytochrome P450 family 150 subfamily A5